MVSDVGSKDAREILERMRTRTTKFSRRVDTSHRGLIQRKMTLLSESRMAPSSYSVDFVNQQLQQRLEKRRMMLARLNPEKHCQVNRNRIPCVKACHSDEEREKSNHSSTTAVTEVSFDSTCPHPPRSLQSSDPAPRKSTSSPSPKKPKKRSPLLSRIRRGFQPFRKLLRRPASNGSPKSVHVPVPTTVDAFVFAGERLDI